MGEKLRPWQTRTHCCGHIVAHDVSCAAQTEKHLLRTQNVSEQNQKHFLCPGHKICVRNKCCPRGQTGKHLCRQQCVRNNVSSFARAFKANAALCVIREKSVSIPMNREFSILIPVNRARHPPFPTLSRVKVFIPRPPCLCPSEGHKHMPSPYKEFLRIACE